MIQAIISHFICRSGRLCCCLMLIFFLLPSSFFLSSASAFVPPDSLSSSPSVSFIPDSSLAAGSLHRFLFGDLWRDIWTTPAVAPIVDPFHTASGSPRIDRTTDDTYGIIRYTGADGVLYTFTPLVRPTSVRFGSDFQELFTTGALKDLSAMAHPYAPLLTARLLEATGVEHVRPELVVLGEPTRGHASGSSFRSPSRISRALACRGYPHQFIRTPAAIGTGRGC